ncbi:MAG: GGDEF domain-containing protein [Pseudomonadota bacterium]
MAQPKLSLIQNTKVQSKKTAQYSDSLFNANNGVLQKKIQQNDITNKLEVDKQTLVKLSNRLHSQIEIENLINVFADEIKPLINLDDIIYKLPNEQTIVNNKGRHYASYNMIFNDISLGEIFFIRKYRFIEEENHFIEKLLISLLSPLFNAIKFYNAVQDAQTDPLTGALNRIGLEKGFSREMDLARRNKDDLSILVLDIDHFKNINDTYGHAFGDTILKEISQHISNCIRTTDVFSRFGGEEFVVLLNNTNRSGALLLAERIRQQIEKSFVLNNDEKVFYTSSIGVATLNNNDNRDSFFNRADKALYEAKENGRNRVVLSQN